MLTQKKKRKMSYELFVKDNEAIDVHLVSTQDMKRTTDALFTANEITEHILKELEAMKLRAEKADHDLREAHSDIRCLIDEKEASAKTKKKK